MAGSMSHMTPSAYHHAGWWCDTTILDDLRRTARQRPSRPAIVTYHMHGSATETLTYGELVDHSERFAAGLHALGVCGRPGVHPARAMARLLQRRMIAGEAKCDAFA